MVPVQLARARRSESGSAVLVLLALLVMMLILCGATTSSVISSRREVGLIEQRQVARLATATNAPAAAAKSAGTP
jgi:cytochrome c biogenesis factor